LVEQGKFNTQDEKCAPGKRELDNRAVISEDFEDHDFCEYIRKKRDTLGLQAMAIMQMSFTRDLNEVYAAIFGEEEVKAEGLLIENIRRKFVTETSSGNLDKFFTTNADEIDTFDEKTISILMTVIHQQPSKLCPKKYADYQDNHSDGFCANP